MKKIFFLVSGLMLTLFFCKNKTTRNENLTIKTSKHQYNSKDIPSFINELSSNHLESFKKIYWDDFSVFCNENDLLENDNKNQEIYFKVKFLNDLFSAKNASNGSVGKILKIPYLWHWLSPNPRHAIELKINKQKLNSIKPTEGFGKYKSFADIDRTPSLFLTELFLENEKYQLENCPSFATFGWCSEREMSFSCLLNLLNFGYSKIHTIGNHCWTEALFEFKGKDNNLKKIILKIDNTFNEVSTVKLEPKNIKKWQLALGNSAQPKWYNKMAKSTEEQTKIKNFTPAEKAFERIENSINTYLKTL